MEINIRNFQCIRKADIVIEPGLTVLIGSSNHGKSALFRAIEAAVYNKSSDSQITAGQTVMLVKYTHEGHSFTFKRDSSRGSKVAYQIDNDVYTKPGRSQLPLIAEIFGFGEVQVLANKEHLNFWKQMKFPFLLDRTGSQLFEFLSFSDEVLLGVSKQIKKDLQQMDKDKSTIIIKSDLMNQKYNDMRELLKEYSKLSVIGDYLQKLRNPTLKTDNMIELLEKTKAVDIRICTLKKALDIYRNKYNCFKELDRVAQEVKSLEGLLEKYQKFLLSSQKQETLREIFARVTQKEASFYTLGTVKEAIEKVQEITLGKLALEEKIVQLEKVKESEKQCVLRIVYNKDLIKEIEVGLSEFDICPLCNSPLGGVKIV